MSGRAIVVLIAKGCAEIIGIAGTSNTSLSNWAGASTYLGRHEAWPPVRIIL
jgi:hypothetical protein